MMNTFNNQKPGAGNQQRNTTSSERLATCSMIAGITGLICSFLYFPTSLYSGTSSSTGLLFGVVGLVLAIMSKNADVAEKKKFSAKAITGIVLSVIAIALTMFFFYLLGYYYDLLRDPEMGPKFNEYINYLQQQINQKLQPGANPGWIHFL